MKEDQFKLVESEGQKSQTKNVSILIVEDNKDMQEYLSIILHEYSCTIKDNGQLALEWLNTSTDASKVNLILSDIMMPIMDGIELLHEVKSIDNFKRIPFILLTAKADIETKLSAMRVGIDDYIIKPFNEDELKGRIASLLNNYFLRINYNTDPPIEIDQTVEDLLNADDIWLAKVEQIVETHLNDERLNTGFLSMHLYISSRHLQRKLKEITGLTPNQYIQQHKIQLARDLLQKGAFKTVKEVSNAIGYNDTKYFTKLFQSIYGVNPSSCF